jgi:hypothetical protein
MVLHRLTHVTMATRDAAAASEFYAEFGLRPTGEGTFATRDGGEQLRLVEDSHRRVLELGLGVDHTDDLDDLAAQLRSIDAPADRDTDTLRTRDRATGMEIVVAAAPRIASSPDAAADLNGPGVISRHNTRAASLARDEPVTPRKLGHVVIGSTDHAGTQRLFTDGLGFKISDEIVGVAAFLRCTTDHHNVLVQDAPVTYVHHTS